MKNLKIITPSIWLKDIVNNSFFKTDVVCINNGINLDVFRIRSVSINLKEKLKIGEKKIILGVASMWDERKGLRDFIKLSSLISSNFVIVLIGLSKSQIGKLPLNTIGIERTEDVHELAEYYNVADVFVNPTYLDNFPTTNLEAMACGTPVITYNTGGSPECLDKKSGIIVNKGDVEGLLSAINTIVNSKTTYSKEICASRAKLLFDKKKSYYKYIQLYKQLIEEN